MTSSVVDAHAAFLDHARLRKRVGDLLAPVGLSLDTFGLLASIGTEPRGRADLAEELAVPASELVRAIQPLRKLGWVDRDDDGRILLSIDGSVLLAQARGLLAAAQD